jgi:hypothetical protein
VQPLSYTHSIYSPLILFIMKKFSNISNWLLAAGIAAVICLGSCKKDNSITNPQSDSATENAATLAATQEDAETDALYDDVFNITGSMNSAQAGEDLGLGGSFPGAFGNGRDAAPDTLNRCFTITVVPNIPHVFPKTVTINFGNGCLGKDGKYRKGKIVSIYTAPMPVPGSKVSTTFLGYHVDSFKVEGTHITENTSTSNMQGWKITVLNGQVTNTNNSRWRKWNSLKQVTQTEGNGTPGFPLDDVYKITGGARGSNAAGHTWASAILDPLIKKFTCRWIVKGTVKIIRDGREAMLDYGNGTCDNIAEITINGVPHAIML